MPTQRFVGPERRRTPRYYVAVPIEFDGTTGTTRDVSESGIRLELDQRLDQGQSIAFHVVFRDFEGGTPWRMAGSGEVLRVEEDGAGFVVAIRVVRYALAEAPSDP